MITQEVINKLKSSYSNIPVYFEKPIEKPESPCFYMKLISGVQQHEVSNRYTRKYSYEIHYYSLGIDECVDKANDLYEKMELLSNIKTKGKNMHYKIENKVLHFYVEYEIRLTKECEEKPKLQNMEVNEYARENSN